MFKFRKKSKSYQETYEKESKQIESDIKNLRRDTEMLKKTKESLVLLISQITI